MKRLGGDGRWTDVSGIVESNKQRAIKRKKSEKYRDQQLSKIRKMLNELHEFGHID